MLKYLIIAAGGALGATMRYLVAGATLSLVQPLAFPYGTLAVNLLGCLLFGFLAQIGEHYIAFAPEVRLLLFTGFLGAFTTFSTFGSETVALLEDQKLGLALAYVGISVVVGLLAVWVGQVTADFLHSVGTH